jgi:sec-independent protein translocase protein TatA
MPNIGAPELIILLIVLLLVFGPKRLPEMGRSLGRGIREFKESVSGNEPPEEPKASPPAPALEPKATPPETPAESTASKSDTERVAS